MKQSALKKSRCTVVQKDLARHKDRLFCEMYVKQLIKGLATMDAGGKNGPSFDWKKIIDTAALPLVTMKGMACLLVRQINYRSSCLCDCSKFLISFRVPEWCFLSPSF